MINCIKTCSFLQRFLLLLLFFLHFFFFISSFIQYSTRSFTALIFYLLIWSTKKHTQLLINSSFDYSSFLLRQLGQTLNVLFNQFLFFKKYIYIYLFFYVFTHNFPPPKKTLGRHSMEWSPFQPAFLGASIFSLFLFAFYKLHFFKLNIFFLLIFHIKFCTTFFFV